MNEEDLKILDELANPMTRSGWAVINAVQRIRALEAALDDLAFKDTNGHWYYPYADEGPLDEIVGDLMDTRTRELKS